MLRIVLVRAQRYPRTNSCNIEYGVACTSAVLWMSLTRPARCTAMLVMLDPFDIAGKIFQEGLFKYNDT